MLLPFSFCELNVCYIHLSIVSADQKYVQPNCVSIIFWCPARAKISVAMLLTVVLLMGGLGMRVINCMVSMAVWKRWNGRVEWNGILE